MQIQYDWMHISSFPFFKDGKPFCKFLQELKIHKSFLCANSLEVGSDTHNSQCIVTCVGGI